MVKRLVPAVLTVLIVSVFVGFAPIHGMAGVAAAGSLGAASLRLDSRELSPYWGARIRQWTPLVLQEAERRELDPDFLASLMWMESRGDAAAVGPVGSVGLMQIMPKEAGFTWRPTRAELLDPATNLYWGTRTLATVVKQGRGDIFNALAAYNGGWAQIMYRGPKLFATTILRDYAYAVAARHGVEGGGWVAYFAVDQGDVAGPIWVADADHDDVYNYGDTNLTPEGSRLIPDVPPTSRVATCTDEGAPCSVEMWLYHTSTDRWIAPLESVPLPVPAAEIPAPPPSLVMAGSSRPGAPADVASAAVTTVQAPAPAQVDAVADATPAAAPVAEAGIDPTGQGVPAADMATCSGGPLRVDAWPLDRTNTPDNGWKVLIYAEGRGGNCSYTYAWNDESDVRAANVRGPVTFEVTSVHRGSVILGTVVVTSGDETQRVGMYIVSPRP